ncbi:MAG: hypothetical protein H6723_19375 [Sandaracinus sp.]|nr:hypothetical protein [Sandaracinus sp.]
MVPRSPSVTADSIRARLAQTLPPALVPQHVLTLNTLPRRRAARSIARRWSSTGAEDAATSATPRRRSEGRAALRRGPGRRGQARRRLLQSGGDSLRALRVVGLLADVLDTPPTVATLIARGTPARSPLGDRSEPTPPPMPTRS